MAEFYTRVELHGGKSADYDKLHAAMKAKGFFRAVTDGNGKVWSLPTAEYHKVSNLTCDGVRDEARSAAISTGLKNIVLTMETTHWSGYFDPP